MKVASAIFERERISDSDQIIKIWSSRKEAQPEPNRPHSRSKNSMDGIDREDAFNYALAEALRQISVGWDENSVLAQPIGIFEGNLSPDVIILDRTMPPLVIESEYSANPDADAISRIGLQELRTMQKIFTVIAISIPDSFRRFNVAQATEALIDGSAFGYAIWQSQYTNSNEEAEELRRFPSDPTIPKNFIEGNLYDLANLIPVASLPISRVDAIATEVAQYVDAGARLMEESFTESEKLEIANLAYQRTSMKGLRTAMVLWLNALLIQHRLSGFIDDIENVRFVNPGEQKLSSQFRVWQKILDMNWQAIFGPAVQMLEVAGNRSPNETRQAIVYLLKSAELIEQSRLGVHISVGGELFPKVSEDRKSAAAYYTLPATAEMLAALTIRQQDRKDWNNDRLFRNLKVADLACGTGTLLRAGYKRIRTFHEQSGGTRQSLSQLHQDAIESGLVGIDISPIAAHFTSSSLAAMSEGESYSTTQIGWVDVTDGKTGSLEFLVLPEIRDLLGSYIGQSRGDGEEPAGDGELSTVSVIDNSIDYFLMNPPYSRTTGKHAAFDIAGLSESERKLCQASWGNQISGRPADKRAGMAASFLVLAHDKVKIGGRIGFVLPMSMAFQTTWTETRRMIEQDFEDIVIVCTSSALNASFSADTGMQEILLIAKRREARRTGSARITCVTLTSDILRLGEAGEVAKSIASSIEKGNDRGYLRVGNQEIGTLSNFVAMNGQPWTNVGAVHHDLLDVVRRLSEDGVLYEFNVQRNWQLPCGMTEVGDLFDVGHSSDVIGSLVESNSPRGTFTFHRITDHADSIGTDRSLWETNNSQRQLVIAPTHKGVEADSSRLENVRSRAGRCFYKQEVRWNSQYLVGSMTADNALGGRAWTALVHPDDRILKITVMWLNSIFGMLLHWSVGGRTQVGRSNLKPTGIKEVPIPNFAELNSDKLDYASNMFEIHRDMELQRLYQADKDEVRKSIDRTVCTVLDLKVEDEFLERLRSIWCAEPSVIG